MLEFKRDISSLKPILKTMVAFANTAGGILIIGRGSDGTVYGVPEVLQTEESLTNAIGHADYTQTKQVCNKLCYKLKT